VKIAPLIGKGVWDQRDDIRDVISIGKLVRKNDGPEEVERIFQVMLVEEMAAMEGVAPRATDIVVLMAAAMEVSYSEVVVLMEVMVD
jgi:hypothetical protein